MGLETVEPLCVGAAKPVVHGGQALELEPGRAALAVASPGDEAGPLQYLEALGNGRLGRCGSLCEFDDTGVACPEALEDGPVGRVCKRSKAGLKGVVCRH